MEKRENKVTPLYLKTLSQKFDLECIFLLDLSNQNIGNLGAIPECKNLLMLDLSRNQVGFINGLDACSKLNYLNLAYNRIASLESLLGCNDLTHLFLQGNSIRDYKTVEFLRNLPKLTHLHLQEFNFSG